MSENFLFLPMLFFFLFLLTSNLTIPSYCTLYSVQFLLKIELAHFIISTGPFLLLRFSSEFHKLEREGERKPGIEGTDFDL
jgi:hypothetical protein